MLIRYFSRMDSLHQTSSLWLMMTSQTIKKTPFQASYSTSLMVKMFMPVVKLITRELMLHLLISSQSLKVMLLKLRAEMDEFLNLPKKARFSSISLIMGPQDL